MDNKTGKFLTWIGEYWIVPTAVLTVILAYPILIKMELVKDSPVTLFLILLFLCLSLAFPLNTKRPWLIPLFLLLPVICIPGLVALASLSTGFSSSLLFRLSPSYGSFPRLEIQNIPFLLNIAMAAALAVWGVWVAYICWRGTSPRHSLIRFSNILLISLVLWCLALGMQTIRTGNVLRRAERIVKLKLVPKKTVNGKELLPYLRETVKLEKELIRKYPKFSPPACGVYSWTSNVSEGEGECRAEEIKETLARWNDPEVTNFFASLDNYASLLPFSGEDLFFKEIDFSLINSLRSFARYQVGRAQVAHYQGRKKDILPHLESAAVFDKTLEKSSFLISELVRNAIFHMRYLSIISLGPTGPEYADIYRRLLKDAENRQIAVPSELKAYALDAQFRLEHINTQSDYFFIETPPFSFLPALLFRPLSLNLISTTLKNAIGLNALLPEINRMTRVPSGSTEFRNYLPLIQHLKEKKISEFDWNTLPDIQDPTRVRNLTTQYDFWYFPANAIRVFGRMKCVQNMAIIGTALKLYQCLHGKYPETLNALVPEILKSLPMDPYSGKSFQYTLKNGEFKLSSIEKFYSCGSKVKY